MEACQATCFWAKITPAFLQIMEWYVPKKKDSIQSYIYFRKLINLEKLEGNYVDKWGSGGDSPQKPAKFQIIR